MTKKEPQTDCDEREQKKNKKTKKRREAHKRAFITQEREREREREREKTREDERLIGGCRWGVLRWKNWKENEKFAMEKKEEEKNARAKRDSNDWRKDRRFQTNSRQVEVHVYV
jgi:hypothetical protein